MKKAVLSVVLSLLAMSTPAYGAESASVICMLNHEFKLGLWEGIIVLSGTFGYMMAATDRLALSSYDDSSAPIIKLKFRFDIWLPITKVALTILSVGLLYNLTTASTGLGSVTVLLFILLTLYLSWTTRCKLLLNPLRSEPFLDSIESGEDLRLKLHELLKKHLMFYLAFYMIIAITFAAIAQVAIQQQC
jgi:hypothetical protein